MAPALGSEHSESLVQQTAGKLQLPLRALSRQQAHQLLQHLRELHGDSGLISVAARLAQSRISLKEPRVSVRPLRATNEARVVVEIGYKVASEGERELHAPRDAAWTIERLADVLSDTLGKERSLVVIRGELDKMGAKAPLTQSQAIVVMDRLSEEKGIVGVVARFAKRRLSVAAAP